MSNKMLSNKSWKILGKVAFGYAVVCFFSSELALSFISNTHAINIFTTAVIASFFTVKLSENSNKNSPED